MARQTRPLTPAEAVRQGRKLIAERRRQAYGPRLGSPWAHPEAEPLLLRMWVEDGAVAAEIAARLTALVGQPVSRNAVLGRIRLLGLVGRGNPLRSGEKAAMQPEAVAQPEPISELNCQPDPPPAPWEGGAVAAVEGKSPASAGPGGAETAIGMPISEQDQSVAAGPEVRTEEPPPAIPAIAGLALLMAADGRLDEFWPKHPDGTWPLADLRSGQCRFACTADDAPRDQHRFCGRPTRISRSNLHGSWCDEHLTRVWGQGSVSERFAHLVTKDVRRFG